MDRRPLLNHLTSILMAVSAWAFYWMQKPVGDFEHSLIWCSHCNLQITIILEIIKTLVLWLSRSIKYFPQYCMLTSFLTFVNNLKELPNKESTERLFSPPVCVHVMVGRSKFTDQAMWAVTCEVELVSPNVRESKRDCWLPLSMCRPSTGDRTCLSVKVPLGDDPRTELCVAAIFSGLAASRGEVEKLYP